MTESVSKAGYLEAMPVRNLTTKTGVRRDFPMEGDIQMVIMKIGQIRPANKPWLWKCVFQCKV